MKKITRAIFVAIIGMSTMIACISCTKKGPWDYPNVDWYSENPVMELHTEYSGEPSIGYMEINGQQVQVYLCWGPPTYTFSIYVYNSEKGISVGTDELLLRGKVKYGSEMATLLISTDNVFGSAFSAIVLSRHISEKEDASLGGTVTK